MSTDELESLMQRYAAGDLAAFDRLYAALSPRVYAYVLTMTGDRARADDLAQVTFLKLHRARTCWIPGTGVLPWVLAIARNSVYDDTRKRSRAIDRTTDTGEVPEPEAEDLEGGGGLPDREILEKAVADAIGKLAPNQREALVLTKHAGLTLRDAAEVLGTTETAVKLRIHRAYATLRKLLKREKESSE